MDGYVLDGTPKSVKITAGPQAPELIFWNKKAGTLVIQKKDSVTGALIPGAQFQLTYANGGYVEFSKVRSLPLPVLALPPVFPPVVPPLFMVLEPFFTMMVLGVVSST